MFCNLPPCTLAPRNIVQVSAVTRARSAKLLLRGSSADQLSKAIEMSSDEEVEIDRDEEHSIRVTLPSDDAFLQFWASVRGRVLRHVEREPEELSDRASCRSVLDRALDPNGGDEEPLASRSAAAAFSSSQTPANSKPSSQTSLFISPLDMMQKQAAALSGAAKVSVASTIGLHLHHSSQQSLGGLRQSQDTFAWNKLGSLEQQTAGPSGAQDGNCKRSVPLEGGQKRQQLEHTGSKTPQPDRQGEREEQKKAGAARAAESRHAEAVSELY